MMVEKKVPGALERMEKGELIPEWEYITEGKLGWEYRQVLAGKLLESFNFDPLSICSCLYEYVQCTLQIFLKFTLDIRSGTMFFTIANLTI